jgi:hypothetical protein
MDDYLKTKDIAGSLRADSHNLYSRCGSYYDKDTNEMIRNTKVGTFKCCINTCGDYLRYCDSLATNKLEKDKCLRYFEDCQEICKNSELWVTNKMEECIKNSECFDNYTTDQDCLTRNKQDLLKCCNEKCPQEEIENCDEYCTYLFDFYEQDCDNKNVDKINYITQDNLIYENLSDPSKVIFVDNVENNKDKTIIVIITYILMTILFFSFLIFCFQKKIKMN